MGRFGLLRGGLTVRHAVDLDHYCTVIAEAHTLDCSRLRIQHPRPLRPRLQHADVIDVRLGHLVRQDVLGYRSWMLTVTVKHTGTATFCTIDGSNSH